MEIDKKILYEAIEKWGNPSQILMAIEELSELSQALCKSFRQEDINKSKVVEEMADVYIMLEQMKILFCDTKFDLQSEIDMKMRRLKNRLENCA